MSASGPAAALRDLCVDAAHRVRDGALRATLHDVAHQLELPLQLAVAGAVSAGKSTLINAVLGRAIAHADGRECTRIVTWFEYGEDDGEVVVERVAGPPMSLRLDAAGRLPDPIGVPLEEIARLRVRLDAPLLRSLTIIDTPGVNTVTAGNEEATRRLLFGDAAAAHAQALVYVLRFVQQFDADTLAEFRALSAATGLTAVNTAVILSQVDRRGEADPWPTAWRLTRRAAEDLRGVALDVAPLVGLLAETARARLLGPAEITGLRALAELSDDDLDDALLDLADFIEVGVPVGGASLAPAVRASLVELLHRYGIRQAVRRLRAHPGLTVETLHRSLTSDSGFLPPPGQAADPTHPTLVDVLERFARHAERLKALAAMTRLRSAATVVAGGPDDRAVVTDLLAAVDETHPIAAGLRELRVLSAAAAYGRGTLRLDDAAADELLRMARAATPAEQLGLPADAPPSAIHATAVSASQRWRAAAQLAGPTTAGNRLRDVLDAVEDLAAEHAPGDRAHTRGGGHEAFTPPADGDRVARLLESPLLSGDDRAAVAALTVASDVHTAVRVGPDATVADVVAAATALATRFRLLQHRPLPAAERRAVEAVCDTFESIAIDMQQRQVGAGG